MNHSTVTIFDKEHIKFILCDCKNEVLVIDYGNLTKTINLAIYESLSSFKHKMSWYTKIKYIWRILTHKYPYNDQIILNPKQTKDLLKFLQEVAL